MPLLRSYRDGEPTKLQICRSYGATGMVNRRGYRDAAPGNDICVLTLFNK